jgi:enamine deaminase RidA (YjgF/YER057c/UK114 family)
LSSNRELINPTELHPAPGFSHIALAKGSRLAFIAGQVALAPDFSMIGEGDLAAQTEAAMQNLGTALQAIGATWGDVVRRTIYTTQPTEFETITAAIEKVQGSSDHPPQTIAGVSGLALPGLLIEIEATVSLA